LFSISFVILDEVTRRVQDQHCFSSIESYFDR